MDQSTVALISNEPRQSFKCLLLRRHMEEEATKVECATAAITAGVVRSREPQGSTEVVRMSTVKSVPRARSTLWVHSAELRWIDVWVASGGCRHPFTLPQKTLFRMNSKKKKTARAEAN